MALSFGWKANETRESIWKDDAALKQPLPAGALEAWREDGDASHLEPYLDGEPTFVDFRALTPDERPYVTSPMTEAENNVEGATRAWLRCFRVAVTLRSMPEKAQSPDGAWHRCFVRERGIVMLANEVVDHIISTYPGMVEFYGGLVFAASFLSDVEKKASSPPSTPTPSSVVASTAVTTAPSPPAEVATGAP